MRFIIFIFLVLILYFSCFKILKRIMRIKFIQINDVKILNEIRAILDVSK